MAEHTLAALHPARGFGSVHDTPGLPAGFTDIFDSYFVDGPEVRLHAVIGGDGPPLLLLAGWPQNWFAWRYLMLPLAERFTVIAADPRGVGLSAKPSMGYDSHRLSEDMFDLMSALGYQQFSMVGHDVGMWTGYAMAADKPGRIDRLVLGEALIPGLSPSPPLISDERWLSDLLWHFNFNRALEINELLVAGREEIYFGHQFQTKAGHPEAIPDYARSYYASLLKDPDALRCSFEYYRALDTSISQNRGRAATPLTLPILAFAGALCSGDMVERELRTVATNVQSLIISDCGHYPAEEKPGELLAALLAFL
ncbi:alpha/beta hydrolase [Vogesella indigofera]|uniref:alpha/beta hydrolase n=1 Tax=Vogesella indigofera TaxID=45465 RepID=UPI0035AF44B1